MIRSPYTPYSIYLMGTIHKERLQSRSAHKTFSIVRSCFNFQKAKGGFQIVKAVDYRRPSIASCSVERCQNVEASLLSILACCASLLFALIRLISFPITYNFLITKGIAIVVLLLRLCPDLAHAINCVSSTLT